MNMIDKVVAEKYVTGDTEIDLSKYESIDTEAARILAQSSKADALSCLPLKGVKALEASTARELAKTKCALDLSGLEKLDEATATALVESWIEADADGAENGILYRTLDLRSLMMTDTAVAQTLARIGYWTTLILGTIPANTDALALFLASQGCNTELVGIQVLSVEEAQLLATSKRQRLSLPDLKEASDEALRSLANGDEFVGDVGADGSGITERFKFFYERNPRVLAEHAALEEDKKQTRERHKAELAACSQLIASVIEAAQRVVEKSHSIRIGLLWRFFGGFASYHEKNQSMIRECEKHARVLMYHLCNNYGAKSSLRICKAAEFQPEIQRLERELWTTLCSVTKSRSNAICGVLQHAADRDYSIVQRLLGVNGLAEMRSACESLIAFLSLKNSDASWRASRGSIMATLGASNEAIREEMETKFTVIWRDTMETIERPLAHVVDRLRAAGAVEEANLLVRDLLTQAPVNSQTT